MRRRLAINVLACPLCLSLAALHGCGAGNPNTGDNPPAAGTTRVTAITFSPESGFPRGADPAQFSVGGGSITAAGGTAGTSGQLGLYADDQFAWDYLAGVAGEITFTGLEVVGIDGYWVHPDSQSGGAVMTVNFSDGGSLAVESAAVNAFGFLGQAAGFFDSVTAPEGETITSLAFAFGEGASSGDVAALDVLELTVLEP